MKKTSYLETLFKHEFVFESAGHSTIDDMDSSRLSIPPLLWMGARCDDEGDRLLLPLRRVAPFRSNVTVAFRPAWALLVSKQGDGKPIGASIVTDDVGVVLVDTDPCHTFNFSIISNYIYRLFPVFH